MGQLTQREKNQRYYAANKEKVKAATKRWAAENAPKVRARKREYYQEHKEEKRNYNRAYAARTRRAQRERGWRRQGIVGLTHVDYDFLLEQQDGRCRICGEEKKLVPDHDMETGGCRGALLCSNCNTGIGLLKHDPERLKRAYEYLSCAN